MPLSVGMNAWTCCVTCSRPAAQPAHRALAAWWASASPQRRAELASLRPQIPREIDRALLHDTSEVYDVSDRVRFELRHRFWDHVQRLARPTKQAR